MSLYNSHKENKKVCRLKFIQPCYWNSRRSMRNTISLKEIAEDGAWEEGWFEPAWKSLNGRDVAYYFKKRDELTEIFHELRRINCRNSYINKLNNIQLNLQHIGMDLDKVYTDIVPKTTRVRCFMKYEAPLIEVDN